MKKKEIYESPYVAVLYLNVEGLLCVSGLQEGSGLIDSPDYEDGGDLEIF